MRRGLILLISVLFITSCSGGRGRQRELAELVAVARLAIEEQLESGAVKAFSEPQYGDFEQGIFVRLIKSGSERGCIGFYRGVGDLKEGAALAALNAAFFDRRFPPLEPSELSELELEVSLVGPFSEMKDPYDFTPGRHSLLIDDYSNRGFLQASVANESGIDREAFLKILCRKAGVDESYLSKSYCRILKAETVSRRARMLHNP